MKVIWTGLIVILFLTVNFSSAYDFDSEISDDDRQTYNGILEPIVKIYNFIKYAASLVGALFLLFAGIMFMTSASDQRNRESAKSMAGYVIIGLAIVWVAPLAVNFITG